MAVIHKLSVGKALDKLRRSDAAQTQLDEKNAALDEDIQRMTAFTRHMSGNNEPPRGLQAMLKG